MAVLDALGWGAWTLPRLFKSIEKNKDSVAILFSAIAELDVYLSIANYDHEFIEKNTLPKVADSDRPFIRIVDGHNPYLAGTPGRASVPNSVHLSPENNFVILTGSNMGGKSTFLRMISLMSTQAQIGATVPAREFEFSTHSIVSNVDIIDSIKDGKSFFDAETDRMLAIIKKSTKPGKLLVVMDEILLGTNPEEREAAEREIIRYFTGTNQLFLLATHDLRVTRLADELPTVSNMHVEEQIEDGKMTFSYQVKPGPATSRNAIKVLEMKGFPKEITDAAQRSLDEGTINR